MTHVFDELWSANAAWRALDRTARSVFLDAVRGAISGLLDKGATVAFGAVDKSCELSVAYDFVGIWSADDPKVLDDLRHAISQSGWYGYFDQVNVLSSVGDPGALLMKLTDE